MRKIEHYHEWIVRGSVLKRIADERGYEPLVRCKDCKHRDPEDKKCDHGDMIHIQHQFPMPDDWFCPLGYAKDGEQE